MLTKSQWDALFRIAKNSIEGERYSYSNGFLKEKRGVFVTLFRHGRLRGCIGFPYPIKELGRATYEAAREAAFNDPRFPPLSKEEMKGLKIEISVLSVPEKCALEDIKKGDGVILEKDGRSALFLPQVWGQLPDKELFLSQLSAKALLPPDAFRSASFKRFHVEKEERNSDEI